MDTKNLKKGDIVQHKLNKDWLLVLAVFIDTVECRTKSFETISLYNFELEHKGGK